MTPKQHLIIISFKHHKSYTKTGKNIDVSRQRVEQVIMQFKPFDPELQAIVATFKRPEFCMECGRSLVDGTVQYSGKGLCRACSDYRKYPNRTRVSIRPLFYPKHCLACEKNTVGNTRQHGYCERCFQRRQYKNDPAFRKRLREAQRRYNIKNYEWHLESMRQYRIKKMLNPEDLL